MSDDTIDVDDWVGRKREQLRNADTATVEVYVRSLSPGFGVRRRQEEIYDRLQTLEADSVFDAMAVSVWGEAACTEGVFAETSACQRVRSCIDRFRNWAAEQEPSIEMPFIEREVQSRVLEETYSDLVLPELCLALHADDELALVVPCLVDGQPLSIDQVLGALEAPRLDREQPAESR